MSTAHKVTLREIEAFGLRETYGPLADDRLGIRMCLCLHDVPLRPIQPTCVS